MFHSDLTLKNDFESIKEDLLSHENGIYLFGYGSLMWKVDFEYELKLFGYVNDYERKFWLLSDDHRGTPDKLGRVATLVKCEPNSNSRVYGVAYKLKKENLDKTFDYLSVREKCGYSLKEVLFHPTTTTVVPSSDDGPCQNDNQILKCLCYYANEENVYYSPQMDINLLANQIYETIGPSGTNKEYLYKLCDALRHLAKDVSNQQEIIESNILEYDKCLFDLERLVKQLDSSVN